MYLFHLFRSFLPLHNPIGFGGSDFVEFGLVLILVGLVFARAWCVLAAVRLARRPIWCMLFLCALVIVLRVGLLPLQPVPTPAGSDDFSYVLLGDTLAHFRLANPTHPMHRFFETTFALQEPSYSSIYALGPGLALALGELLFGLPWAGVLLSMGVLCALCYWALRGWTSSGWALVGGLLAVCEFGPLNAWMNRYWGGAVSGIAGCLVFGALPRIRERWQTRDAVLLGIGVGLQMITRPFESLFLDLSIILFFLPELRRQEWSRLFKIARPALLAFLPAAALLLLHNHAVTGNWTTLPYALSRYQYGVPTTFTFQPNAVPHNTLTEAQQLYYAGQARVHGEETETLGTYFDRLGSRAGFYRFFFLAPLCVALLFFLPLLREYRYLWIVLTFLLFALGTNVYPYFFVHYLAAETCLFLLVAILGLQRLSEWQLGDWRGGSFAAAGILFLCAAHFLFWYFVHAQGDEQILWSMTAFETAPGINFGDVEGRIAVEKRLQAEPGRQLVFVRYFPTHGYLEWIHNDADIDQARVVWALELNPDDNAKLKALYPDRKVWLMEPDAQPPKLVPYPVSAGPFLPVE
ncbi:MAG TPA: hypothetical protein VKU19_35855 [Bryobacteraceae bacterium]|nr:hypothetical protein [Bryobacteraceae bacterium]